MERKSTVVWYDGRRWVRGMPGAWDGPYLAVKSRLQSVVWRGEYKCENEPIIVRLPRRFARKVVA